MAFYGYKGDLDEYYLNPYKTTYDYNSLYSQIQTKTDYDPRHEFTGPAFVTPVEANYPLYTWAEPENLLHNPTAYYSSYSYYEHSPEDYYYSEETNLLQQNPPSSYAQVLYPPETKFTVSYSTAKFNEPEFKEYDPTPYGGGYDPVETYGKPLPPSDITCYPRSSPKPENTAMESFSFTSVPSPYDRDDGPNGRSKEAKTKPSKPEDAKMVSFEKEEMAENDETKPSNGTKPEEAKAGHFRKKEEVENGGYEKEYLPRIPYGSGLEAMDICESLFGYWPCLAKRAREQKCDNCGRRDFCDGERSVNPWETAADYLFGTPLVYDYESYQQQHQYAQYNKSWENSWLQ